MISGSALDNIGSILFFIFYLFQFPPSGMLHVFLHLLACLSGVSDRGLVVYLLKICVIKHLRR